MTEQRQTDEYRKTEKPFMDQLQLMGWAVEDGDTEVPYLSGERESFRGVFLREDLRDTLRRINRYDGEPWLDEARIDQAVYELERSTSPNLMEANKEATDLLQEGTVVEGDPDLHDGKNQTVHYIDYDHPGRNTFRAIRQFRVDRSGTSGYIVPDVVLFVNGIPLVVVECKRPTATNPIESGVEDLLQYSNQRDWIDEPEGAQRLFFTNQLLVATNYDRAVVGTVGARSEHYIAWKDTSPVPSSKVAERLGTEQLSQQETLVAGMLRPSHLLQLLQHFTLFKEDQGQTVKMVARYQQFRAVHNTIRRLQNGQTRPEHGMQDQRGGIIWHTQGSGKSLTMVFLVRIMRAIPELRRFKVVVVTDRVDLQNQLSKTATLSGETVRIADSTDELKRILQEEGPGLVFATIQKYQEQEVKEEFPVLNESEDIVVLVDEAHRSQTSDLHANLMRALPNCAKIGFTGTPILMGQKKRTHEIFGDYLDTYTIEQAVEDGVIVKILYEGRMERAALKDGRTLDELFDAAFSDRPEEEREKIKSQYATKRTVLEAEPLIRAKAEDMVRHYAGHVLPNNMKAQVVATSRLAAVRYQEALTDALDAFIEEVENVDRALLGLSEEQQEVLEEDDPEAALRVKAHDHLDKLRRLKAAAVISGAKNDPPSWSQWSGNTETTQHINRFKKPLVHHDPAKQDGLAFLCVCTKLLTGFDAPVEQVLYLDRQIREHNLLQAIARVNRLYKDKEHGLVVDYYNVASHLEEALDVYSEDDVKGALIDIKEELPRLEDRHQRVVGLLEKHGITDLWEQEEEAVDLLRDPKLRADFVVRYKEFMASMDTVMPRPEALSFQNNAKQLGKIKKRAANRYRDDSMDQVDAGAKVRRLIDEHLVAEGIDPKVPPVSLLDAEFSEHVESQPSERAKASEMEHAARHHIRKHRDEDPVYYDRLSERLEKILEEYEEDWEALQKWLFEDVIEPMREGREEDETELDPDTEAPFFSLLEQEVLEVSAPQDDVADEEVSAPNPRYGTDELPDERREKLSEITVDMVGHIEQEVQAVDFWRNNAAQKQLRGWIVQYLDDYEVVPFEKLEATADKIVDLAKNRHSHLVN
ncbi:type I restriction endonuclease subunit R [Salinibacter ruber]|uniref:type I restriction endonuclease subunit R n=1 Tax=Salinibacter ruber TaxID=146919 RepID=UPI0021672C4C|nr:type I restriction endonuclease subunit R [Salinibacter ruber]MCS4174581.1 type I restriction enzyme R subunit [Salinibacter ruber]